MSKAHSTAKSFSHYRYIIGIDPGTKTGVAMWDRQEGKFLAIATMNIIEATTYVVNWQSKMRNVLVVIEDARTRSGTDAAKMGAGSIRRDCAIWQEFSEFYGVDILWRATPRGKIRTTKLSAEVFEALTGWKERTSNHARDAAMLVWKT